jgi:hypothetical protein
VANYDDEISEQENSVSEKLLLEVTNDQVTEDEV